MGLGDFLNNVVNSIPVVGHIKGGIHGLVGDVEGAREAIQAANSCTSAVVNSIPVVGHVKGVIHHMAGDREGAKEAYRSANRSSLVIGAAAVAGPAGAAAAAVGTGVAMDTVESLNTGAKVGYLKNVDAILHAKGVTDVIAGVGKIALDVGCDVVAGSAGGAISSVASMPGKQMVNQSSKAIARAVGVTVTRNTEKEVVGYALDRASQEESESSSESSWPTMSQPSTPGSRSESSSESSTMSEYISFDEDDEDEDSSDSSDGKKDLTQIKKGYIYFFLCAGGFYKVGLTKRPIEKRLNEHRRNPDPALRPMRGELIIVFECDDVWLAETTIKQILRNMNVPPIRGREYFQENIRRVVEQVVAEVNSRPLVISYYELNDNNEIVRVNRRR